MSNKTISINPSVFSLGKKTKKNKEKNVKPIASLISPNVLKKKLLNRIKEHKRNGSEGLDKSSNLAGGSNEDKTTDTIDNTFSDEFSDSINYLQTLSKQKNVIDEKKKYENRINEKKNRTLKNYNAIKNNNLNSPFVNIDLPEELQAKEFPISMGVEEFQPNINLSINMNSDVPYGILKGGNKPLYRDWMNKTIKNNIVTNSNAALTIENLALNNIHSERESRLNNLRNKLKQKQIEEESKKSASSQSNIDSNIESNDDSNVESNPNTEIIRQTSTTNFKNDENIGGSEEIIGTKKITKKTIKTKYTLGKSRDKNKVSVLVKDRGTRKQILSAQKGLKKKSIEEIKNYLRDHNLIKIGSSAPNDVLRKLYESAMLSGEITNSNVDTLLHNFSKDEKEL